MIEKSAFLECPPERAFALFTEHASDWWPETLRHTSDPASEIRLLASGRFWERATDGREVELGRVIAWEPAQRLILDFYPGTDADHPTKVVVSFAADGEGGTRVVVLHGPKPESADLFAKRAPRFERSWTLMLPALEDAAHDLFGNDDVTN
jgi:Activator of Hsp90 ATPase homolog 1-like protein